MYFTYGHENITLGLFHTHYYLLTIHVFNFIKLILNLLESLYYYIINILLFILLYYYIMLLLYYIIMLLYHNIYITYIIKLLTLLKFIKINSNLDLMKLI